MVPPKTHDFTHSPVFIFSPFPSFNWSPISPRQKKKKNAFIVFPTQATVLPRSSPIYQTSGLQTKPKENKNGGELICLPSALPGFHRAQPESKWLSVTLAKRLVYFNSSSATAYSVIRKKIKWMFSDYKNNKYHLEKRIYSFLPPIHLKNDFPGWISEAMLGSFLAGVSRECR